MGVKPNGKLLETNMVVKACDPPLLHGAFQCSRCPPSPFARINSKMKLLYI